MSMKLMNVDENRANALMELREKKVGERIMETEKVRQRIRFSWTGWTMRKNGGRRRGTRKGRAGRNWWTIQGDWGHAQVE